ncbi:MAG TPA: hypothetical protein HA283_03580 [Nanoarchaeota archaeon]|nr:hypothetical protein [Nanoarchaeota archaeon]HIH63352.1 hypothetical protein [Nanoarchaeota archaeon]HIJ09976.1 hypothetical protein [Nanoarchaeota archaeon]
MCQTMNLSHEQLAINKRIDIAQNDINRWNPRILENMLDDNLWIGIIEFPGDNGIFIDYTTKLDTTPRNYLDNHEKLLDIFTDPKYEWSNC